MTNKRTIQEGRYEAMEHQQFVERNGKSVIVTKENPRNPLSIGQAYAFFDCPASKEEIEAELPTIREYAQTPKELELSLVEGMDNLESIAKQRNDTKLLSLAEGAREVGRRYCLEGTYPSSDNSSTAVELKDILNTAYASDLFPVGKFHREVLYFNEQEQDWFELE